MYTKFLLVLIPGIIAFFLMKLKSKYRMLITGFFVVAMILINVAYNYVNIPRLMTLRTYTNQLIYQEAYEETKEYPDALLPFLTSGKTIYVKKDFVSYIDAETTDFSWLYPYYHHINPMIYFARYGSDVKEMKELNNSVIDGNAQADFTQIGYANDMLRNACMYYPEKMDPAKYFYHYVYYNEESGPMNFYVNFKDILEADELVLLWQNVVENDDTEYLYLMTKDYYDRNIK